MRASANGVAEAFYWVLFVVMVVAAPIIGGAQGRNMGMAAVFAVVAIVALRNRRRREQASSDDETPDRAAR